MKNNKFFAEVLERLAPKGSNMSSMTDLYKKNLEYMSAINKVMHDVTKTIYEVHVGFVKELAANSKDVFEKATSGKKDLASSFALGKDAMNKCYSKCGDCSKTLNDVVGSSGKKIIDLTKKHAEYAKSHVTSSPILHEMKGMMSDFDPFKSMKKANDGYTKSDRSESSVKRKKTAAKKPAVKKSMNSKKETMRKDPIASAHSFHEAPNKK